MIFFPILLASRTKVHIDYLILFIDIDAHITVIEYKYLDLRLRRIIQMSLKYVE